jgi:hypothetical protein
MDDNIILTKFLRVGDVVIYAPESDSHRYQQAPVNPGDKGKMVGWYSYQTSFGRNQSMSYEKDMDGPGIYQGNGAAVIRWDNGITERVNCHEIKFEDPDLKKKRFNDPENEIIEKPLKISELPVTAFWEGDVVSVVQKHGTYTVTVRSVDHLSVFNRIKDHNEYSGQHSEGWTTYFTEEQATLISRGNYWWWWHDKSKLSFKVIQEEASFFRSLGKFEQLISPKSGNYQWEIQEAIDAIIAGEADCVSSSGSFFGSSPFPIVFKVRDNPDLARRLREEVIKANQK